MIACRVVGQGNDVVAVPADAAADVQQDRRHVEENRRQFVGDGFCGVEVAGVEAEQFAAVRAAYPR